MAADHFVEWMKKAVPVGSAPLLMRLCTILYCGGIVDNERYYVRPFGSERTSHHQPIVLGKSSFLNILIY
jgi:hypothetical protein